VSTAATISCRDWMRCRRLLWMLFTPCVIVYVTISKLTVLRINTCRQTRTLKTPHRTMTDYGKRGKGQLQRTVVKGAITLLCMDRGVTKSKTVEWTLMASAKREPITGVWGQSPQIGPGAERVVRGSGTNWRVKLQT